jgi:hypothetical protein
MQRTFRGGVLVGGVAVAVVAMTPIGAEAGRVVAYAKRAGFATRAATATNAKQVNGLKASRTPRPGQLLALDGSGHFPASAVPRVAPVGPVAALGAGSGTAVTLTDSFAPMAAATLKTTAPARLLVNASIGFVNDAAVSGGAYCRIAVSPAVDGASTLPDEGFASLAAPPIGVAATYATVGIVSGSRKPQPPGTYVFTLECERNGFAGTGAPKTTTSSSGTVVAWAAAG